MKKLIINTQFPPTVETLLLQYDLVESRNIVENRGLQLGILYPQDVLSQELGFWFAMAQGCGLVNDWRLEGVKPNNIYVGGSIHGATIVTGNNNVIRGEEKQ